MGERTTPKYHVANADGEFEINRQEITDEIIAIVTAADLTGLTRNQLIMLNALTDLTVDAMHTARDTFDGAYYEN